MTITPQARSFDKAAASHAANRPSYPPALLDAVEELADRHCSPSRPRRATGPAHHESQVR